MATNPIYVETEEEIPELVERLRRFHGEDTMLVLPMRSRIGQSRFNFQLLRNYSARLGKRVTVVCDDPAIQKMASESGFAVFGAVGPQGEGIPSEAEAPAPIRKWWQRKRVEPTTHIGIAAPTRLLTKTATELKPGRFLLYVTAITLILVGIFAAAVFVPSASVTLVAQAQPFSTKDVEIQAQPGKAPIHVRAVTVSNSNSQGFKVTGSIDVPLAAANGQVVYTNAFPVPCPGPDCGSPGLVVPYGQRLMNTNGLEFAQTSGNLTVPWATGGQLGTVTANIVAVKAGTTGNVGSHTITKIENNRYDRLSVDNPQATGNGTDPSSTPQMTEADFDAARAQLEQEIHQTIAQQIQASGQAGEKLSETIIFGPPQYTTDHQPQDKVPSFTGTMTVTGEGDFYSDADVITAYKTYLTQHVPNNLQLLTESPTQVQYRLLSSAKGGYLVFVGTASAYVAPTLDEAQIRAAIVGRPTAQARFYLEKLPIRSVAIKEEPLALPLMPLLDRRITLHYVVESNAPSASAASQGTPKASPSPSPKPSP
ncbi:MAG TPA: baseplate J/gp47 family protein [Candidatus Limnocylindrales bacterium]|nr:baseplate J/gp47 family protein [Candidatus Limnocylindrales bacterium]